MNLIKVLIITIAASLPMGATVDQEVKVNKDANFIEIQLPVDMPEEVWGQWTVTACYKGLDFRVKKRGATYDGDRYKWGVQFRNRYYEKIYFSYEVYDSRPYDPRSTHRTDLDPNEVSSGYQDYYMNNGNSIYVYVDKARFGKDGLQDYYQCDN